MSVSPRPGLARTIREYGGQFITSLENRYPIVLRNRHRGYKYEL